MTAAPTPHTFKTREERELVPRDSPLAPFISVNPGRMHGEPCFRGTRVPVQALFDHLRAGDSLDVFLNDFSPVTQEQAVAVLDLATNGLLQGLRNL